MNCDVARKAQAVCEMEESGKTNAYDLRCGKNPRFFSVVSTAS